MLARLFRLPAFLTAVGALFWCFQGALLTGLLRVWRLGPRSDVQAALRFLKAFFGYRLLKLPGPDVCKQKCVYLANHRGWCDFFVDMWATSGRAVPLSRRAVGMAFPAFTSSLLAIKSILLFNRKGIRDTEKFNAWLDEELAEGPQNSLLVYPEGTRSLKAESLPLKRGMLRYAFTRRLPVQVVITAGKEEVLCERRRWVHFGRTLATGCSEVLESSQFEDFEAFMAAVQALWDREWARVHSAARIGLPELHPSFPLLQYSPAQLALETAALAFWTAVLLAIKFFAAKGLLRLALSGSAGLAAVVALVLWWAASLAAASLVQPPKPRSAVAPAGSGAAANAGGGEAQAEAAAGGAATKED